MKERQERLKIQRDILLRKKQEERENEIKNYQEGLAGSGGQGMNEEEEKNQRIKKGLAALSLEKKNVDEDQI